MTTHVTPLTALSAPDIAAWNQLASNPFQRWEWLGSWWHAYQPGKQLFVLRVERDSEIIGYAPWFLESRLTTGKTIQFLGSGKACSDHLSLLAHPDNVVATVAAIAPWLKNATESSGSEHQWDSIELIGADRNDLAINTLADGLRREGLDVDQTEGEGCYVIDLPADWESYIRMRSKSGRREIRQSQKNIDDGLLAVQIAETEEDIASVWQQFVELHQRRRSEAGTTGCFDHPPFGDFLRLAATELLKSNLLRLVIASHEGTPVAAQFALIDDDCWYFYQSGMEPQASHLRPGLSLFTHAIRNTIDSGRSRFDMLRGDEPYKLRWRAELKPAQELRVCSPNVSAQLRKQAYNVGVSFKNLVKSGITLTRSQS